MIRTTQLLSALTRRMFRVPFVLTPEGKVKFALRAIAARATTRIPAELLVNPGETVLLLGEDRLENILLWSDLVGDFGRLVLVDSHGERLEALRIVLDTHVRWPLHNIVYMTRQDGQSLDFLLAENAIASVNHVHIGGGGELDALAGMKKTLDRPGVRVYVRASHVKDGRVFFPQVVESLRGAGFAVAVGRDSAAFEGKDIYAARFPQGRRSRAQPKPAHIAR